MIIWHETYMKCEADSMSEAALPVMPLLLVALMLPVTLELLGLVNRRTTRYKCCLPSFGFTCTVTLTSLCRDESDTQLTVMAQAWVEDEGIMLRDVQNHVRWAEELSKQSGLINSQQAKVRKENTAKEGSPFTYSHSKTESQLHPPPRSLLSLVLSPYVEGLSSALQYGKGQQSQGWTWGSPPAKER